MVDGAHGQNGPSVRECVEEEKRSDIGSVTTQHRRKEDKTVVEKEFKRHRVTTRNVQVSNCNVVKLKEIKQLCCGIGSRILLCNSQVHLILKCVVLQFLVL